MTDPRDKILELAVAVNSAENLDDLIAIVMKKVGELFPYDRASIALVDAGSEMLEIRDLTARTSDSDVPEDRGKKIPIDESNVLGWVFLNGVPHLRDSKARLSFQAATRRSRCPVPHRGTLDGSPDDLRSVEHRELRAGCFL